jgi:hypothetical protein
MSDGRKRDEITGLLPEDELIRQVYAENNTFFRTDRYTGKSTRIAIKIINEALANPGKTIKIADHDRSHKSCRSLAETVIRILDLLCVDFKGGITECQITVEPLTPELHYERR